MLLVLSIVIGIAMGYALLSWPGVVVGALLGGIMHTQHRIQKRLDALTVSLSHLTKRQALEHTEQQRQPASKNTHEHATVAAKAIPSAASRTAVTEDNQSPATPKHREPATTEPATKPQGPEFQRLPTPHPIPPLDADNPLSEPLSEFLQRLHDINIVLKVGVVVLFFGVGFLLKYAVDQDMFPVSIRLAAVAIGALILFGIGWRLRVKNPPYAQVLQGAGIGIAYITIYAAAKIFTLLAWWPAFAVMTLLVVLSTVAAAIQNARALAAFSLIGGFLAPILLSEGEINHRTMFVFYAFLNAIVVSLAWFRTWRDINLLGFSATAAVAVYWGHFYYQPSLYFTAQIFLLVFFLAYAAVTLLFAVKLWQQQTFQWRLDPTGYVDAGLVFGVPGICFSLQIGLVADNRLLVAISALIIGIFYGAGYLLLRRFSSMVALRDTYLALSIVFSTLAMPFLLDGNWTSVAWAWESTALLWFGVRYQKPLLPWFASLLQVCAGLIFLSLGVGRQWLLIYYLPIPDSPALINSSFIGGAMIALAGFLSALQLHGPRVQPWQKHMADLLLMWSLLWWSVTGILELYLHVSLPYLPSFLLAFFSLTAIVCIFIGERRSWRELVSAAQAIGPAGFICAFLFTQIHGHFVLWHSILPWLLFIFTQYFLLKKLVSTLNKQNLWLWHVVTFYFLILVALAEIHWRLHASGILDQWMLTGLAVLPMVILFCIVQWGKHAYWPFSYWYHSLGFNALAPLAISLYIWIVVLAGLPGANNYLPLLNGMDIEQFACYALLLRFIHYAKMDAARPLREITAYYSAMVVSLIIIISAVIARGMHHFTGLPYDINALLNSIQFQAAITLSWTATAFIAMLAANRNGNRIMWFTGAVILGLTVLKIFFFDLTSAATMARIISFLAVGIFMLIIGYYSPLPPKVVKQVE